jgi:hypothetical protein
MYWNFNNMKVLDVNLENDNVKKLLFIGEFVAPNH